MSEAINVRDFGKERFTAEATVGAREIIQTPSGKAGYLDSTIAVNSGESAEVVTKGTVTASKTTGFVALKGGRAYWDHSANAINFEKVNDRDFYVGRFAEDAVSAAAFCTVILNEDPPYDIDIMRDPFLSVLVGTAAAGGFGYPVSLGGSLIFELTSTSEAQKVDALSVDGFATGANAIIEGVFRVQSDGAGTEPDVSIGAANGTHASDFDSVTESLLIHLNGNSTTIYAESDDGTTEVAATDTSTTYSEGSAVANRVEFWMDMRSPSDVQIYINGSLVLGSTVFAVNAAVGPWFLVCHVEKTSSASVYKLALDRLTVRYAEQ